MKTIGRVKLGDHLRAHAGEIVDVLQFLDEHMHVIHNTGRITLQPLKNATVIWPSETETSIPEGLTGKVAGKQSTLAGVSRKKTKA